MFEENPPPKKALPSQKLPANAFETPFVSFLYCKMTFPFGVRPSWGELGETSDAEVFGQRSPLPTAASALFV